MENEVCLQISFFANSKDRCNLILEHCKYAKNQSFEKGIWIAEKARKQEEIARMMT